MLDGTGVFDWALTDVRTEDIAKGIHHCVVQRIGTLKPGHQNPDVAKRLGQGQTGIGGKTGETSRDILHRIAQLPEVAGRGIVFPIAGARRDIKDVSRKSRIQGLIPNRRRTVENDQVILVVRQLVEVPGHTAKKRP